MSFTATLKSETGPNVCSECSKHNAKFLELSGGAYLKSIILCLRCAEHALVKAIKKVRAKSGAGGAARHGG